MASVAKTNIDKMLATNTPPLSQETRDALDRLVKNYTVEDADALLEGLRTLFTDPKFQAPNGAEANIVEAVIGPGTGKPSEPHATGGGVGQAFVLTTPIVQQVQVSFGASTSEGPAIGNSSGGNKFGAQVFNPLQHNKHFLGTYPSVTIAPEHGDAGEAADRLRAWLSGDDSKVDVSEWEKQLIKQGVLDDPKKMASSRRDELKAALDKAQASADAKNAKGGQRVDKAGANIGYMSDLKTREEKLQDKIDAMGDLSQMQAMRLQIYMDRRSKFFETLSNIMKKTASTVENIVNNLK